MNLPGPTPDRKEDRSSPPLRRLLHSLGPAIIVASVVLGPGSILASSRLGAEHGYALVWVLALSCALMMVMVSLGVRLGLALDHTPCAELARRTGRPTAVAIGVVVFLIITCFQVGNNTAVLAVLRPAADPGYAAPASRYSTILGIALLNGLTLASLFGFRHLYRWVERLMMLLVLLMLIGFAGNLLFVQPNLISTLQGLVPSLPDGLRLGLMPFREGSLIIDPLGGVVALVATTLSVAGAFFQAYLVREKGWTHDHMRQGNTDTLAGILVLGGISLAILLTSAAVFHGLIPAPQLRTPADVARQLEPLFGPSAHLLFNLGLFAAAFSSFLVNALIGGTVLADSCGLDSSMQGRPAKLLTTLALLLGMGLAIALESTGSSPVGIILIAQALTVLGLPALALAMLYLATLPQVRQSGLAPAWLIGAGVTCLLLTLALAVRKTVELWLLWSAP